MLTRRRLLKALLLSPLAVVAVKLGIEATEQLQSPWKSTERITRYSSDDFGRYDVNAYMRTDLTDWDNLVVAWNDDATTYSLDSGYSWYGPESDKWTNCQVKAAGRL